MEAKKGRQHIKVITNSTIQNIEKISIQRKINRGI
jgi:hypothetical protein